MIRYTFADFEKAVASGNAHLASTIEKSLIKDEYPCDYSMAHADREDFDVDEMAEIHKAALSRGHP